MAPCRIGVEACCGAHHLGRQLLGQGHDVRLMPPKYAQPFVKRDKNDTKDAEACAEACLRPTMRFVAVKSEAQLVNPGPRLPAGARPRDPARQAPLRHSAPGDPRGCRQRPRRPDTGPAGGHAGRMGAAERENTGRRPRTGGGSAAARGLRAAAGGAGQRGADGDGTGGGGGGREGLREGARPDGLARADAGGALEGGRQRLGGISKRGNGYRRTLLVHCARLGLETLAQRSDGLGIWLRRLLKSKDRRVVIVALAARLARIAWALLTSGQRFTAQPKPVPAG